jgi:hypothetical protein
MQEIDYIGRVPLAGMPTFDSGMNDRIGRVYHVEHASSESLMDPYKLWRTICNSIATGLIAEAYYSASTPS